MPHDGHLMQGGLAVKENVIPILNVPFHLVAILQLWFLQVLYVPKVELCSILADDELGPWVHIRAINHQLLQLVDVERCHRLWNGQVLGNWSWNSDLVNRKHWIWCYYSPGREIDSLSHEVKTKSPSLSSQSLLQAFDRPSILVLWYSRIILCIIKKCCNQKLKIFYVLVLDLFELAILVAFTELNIVLQDPHVLMCQVILWSTDSFQLNARPHLRWGNRQHGYYQGFRSGKLWFEAQDLSIIIWDVLEYPQCVFGPERSLSIITVILRLSKLRDNTQLGLLIPWLVLTTALTLLIDLILIHFILIIMLIGVLTSLNIRAKLYKCC